MTNPKAAGATLVIGVLLAIGGTTLTLRDWETATQEKKIEYIQASELGPEQKNALLSLLMSKETIELQEAVSRLADDYRKKANSEPDVKKRARLTKAASGFSLGADLLTQNVKNEEELAQARKRLSAYQKETAKTEVSQSILEAMQKEEEKIKQQNEKLSQQLEQQMVGTISDLGKINEQGDPDKSESNPMGILGILGSGFGGLIALAAGIKLYLECKKLKMENAILEKKQASEQVPVTNSTA
jgi:hypothetical protein